MDIDSLSTDQILSLVEGYYCFVPAKETRGYLENLLLGLIEFHETSDKELAESLSYYDRGDGSANLLPFDSDYRKEFLDAL